MGYPKREITKLMSKRFKKLLKVSKRLTTHQLRRLPEHDIDFDITNLFNRDVSDRASPYFLGYYSPDGIRYALESYGFFKILKEKGYDNIQFSINTRDPYKQQVTVHYDTKDPEHLLVELVVKKKHITIYPPFPAQIYGRNFEVIAVEWLCMQNPKGQYTSDKPKLPGQKYPGLGLGYMTMDILVIMCGRLRTAGLLNRPDHFHNAHIYSSQFRYVEPVHEAKRQAIVRDLLPDYSLPEISWAIDLQCITENAKDFKWEGNDQIIPIDRDLKEYFNGKSYKQYVIELREQYHYQLDRTKFAEKIKEKNIAFTC
jgi:hypothetical protein